MINIKKLTTIQEILGYWRKCLEDLPKRPDLDAAYDLARVVVAPPFDELYEGASRDKRFAAIYDYASDLELPQGDKRWRAYRWQRIKKLVGELSDKYCQKQ